MPETVETMETNPQLLQQYPDRFLQCRVLLHAWREVGLPWVEAAEDGAQVVHEKLKCARCDTERTDQRSLFGRLLRRRYHHEKSYRTGTFEKSKEKFATERYRRILGTAIQEAV